MDVDTMIRKVTDELLPERRVMQDGVFDGPYLEEDGGYSYYLSLGSEFKVFIDDTEDADALKERLARTMIKALDDAIRVAHKMCRIVKR